MDLQEPLTTVIMNHPHIDNMLSSLSMPCPQWGEDQETALLEPFTYVASCPGKGVRNKLIEAFDQWLQIHPAQLQAIVRTVELLHNASLLVDDIEDGSELRRGKPVAHKVYGVPQTINTANYVYFLAYQEVLKIPHACPAERPYILHFGLPRRSSSSSLRFVQILNNEMLALHRGQGLELFWRDYLQCPSEEEYVDMVKGKTAGLLRVAIRLMMECSNIDVDFVPLIDLLGIWFQIRDDYMNLESNTYGEQKGFAEDLEEGKFSFPIVHGIREKPDSKYILNVLHQRSKNPVLKSNVISYLRDETHSFEYTRSVLASLELQARTEIARLGGNPKLEAIIDKLTLRASDCN